MIYFVGNNLVFNKDCKTISVEESLHLLSFMDVIGLDTETTGLDCYTDKLLSLQLGNYKDQVVIDCSDIDVRLYKDLLESDRLFLGWNLKFDLKFLYKNGIVPVNVYDGFLAEKLMYLGYPSGIHSLSLKTASMEYLNIDRDKTIRGKIIYRGLDNEVIKYAADDVKYLEKIKKKQEELLEKKDLMTAIDIENRFVIPLAYCEYCGIKLDEKKWRLKMLDDEKRVNKAKDNLDKWLMENEPDSKYIYIERQGNLFTGFDLTPHITLNWNSVKQLAPLFKKYGVDIMAKDKQTGGMKESLDVKILKPQASKCSLISLYIEYREAVKVTSTYGQNFLDQINPVCGRIISNINQMGADTTRVTSGGKDKASHKEYINLLNLPSDEETRSCFVAEKGNKWISIDYSGQ